MSDPLVSVVIPAYNQERLLRQTLTTALQQTLTDLEVIVVDDGSSDATEAACASFDDSRLRYVRQPNDGTKGIGARNAAILRATGRWVAPLDQDDLWMPDKLEKQVRALEGRDGAGAAFCRAEFVDADGVRKGEQAGPLPEGAVFHSLLRANRYFVSTGIFDRRLIARMGLPHESVGLGDWALWLSVARHTDVVAIDEVLVRYRIHEEGFQASQLAGDPQAFWQDHRALADFAESRLHDDCPDCAEGLAGLRRMISLNCLSLARAGLSKRRLDARTRKALSMAWTSQPTPWTLAAAVSGMAVRRGLRVLQT